MDSWQHKVVLVTGGSAGLGLAIARAFARAGARVAVAARDAGRLREAVERLKAEGHGEVHGLPADVTRPEQVEQLVAGVVARFGQLDVLVNNAGRSSRGLALETTPEQFQELWELNFLALVRCTRAAAPHLLETGGHVVNIGSLAAKSAAKFLGAYPASKFPVAAYSQQLRLELRPQGVHVLLVCPGPIRRTDAGQRYDQQAVGLPEHARRPGGGVQLRGLEPDEVAQQILKACRRRSAELILPGKARWLFALQQLWPSLGDRILLKKTSSA